MDKTRKATTKAIAAFLISIILLSGVSYAVTNPQIEQKKSELGDVNKQIDSLNLKLEEAVEQYNQSYSKISQTKKKINESRDKISRITEDLKYNQNILNGRAKALYVNGRPSFVDLLFSVTDFSGLLNFLDFYNRILKQEKDVIVGVKNSKKELELNKIDLDAKMAQQVINTDKAAQKKQEIQDAVEAKEVLLNRVKGQLAELQRQERERLKKIREEALRKLAKSPAFRSGPNGKAVEIAKQYLGVRYTWGGESPNTGFDCSGLTYYVYRQLGVNLPRTSSAQYSYLNSQGRSVSESSLTAGDLVFYGRGHVSHVVIYMGEGYIIGASGGQYIAGEVKILPLHYRSDYIGAGRP